MTSPVTPCAAEFLVFVRRSRSRRSQQSGLVTALGFLCLLYFKGVAIMTHALFSTYQHPNSVERMSKGLVEFTILLYKYSKGNKGKDEGPIVGLAVLKSATKNDAPPTDGVTVADVTTNTSTSHSLTSTTRGGASTSHNECAANEQSNLLMSPLAMCAALAMTYAGASEETATEIKAAMRLPHDSSELNFAFEDILGSLVGLERPGIKFHIANRMYVPYYTRILPEFLGVVNNHYRTSVAVVNFENEAETVRHQINRWVEGQTNDKIRDILVDGDIDKLTQLALVNAAYFKGNWDQKFESLNTKPANFFTTSTKKVTVEMMEQLGWFFSGGSIDLQCRILELPYVGKDLSMFIILPDEIEGLRDLEEGLSPKTMSELFNKMYESKVHVVMPRLRMETTLSMDDILKKMDMTLLFKRDKADLSGISGTPNLHVSAIVHKTALEVNEEGSAALPKPPVVMDRSMPLAEPEFVVDHPFLLLVRDNRANMILFMGRVVNPSITPTSQPSKHTVTCVPVHPQVHHPTPTVKFAPCPVIQYCGQRKP